MELAPADLSPTPAEVRERFARVAAAADPAAEVDALGASLGPDDIGAVETFDGRTVVTPVSQIGGPRAV